jgi:hypothetical protein
VRLPAAGMAAEASAQGRREDTATPRANVRGAGRRGERAAQRRIQDHLPPMPRSAVAGACGANNSAGVDHAVVDGHREGIGEADYRVPSGDRN